MPYELHTTRTVEFADTDMAGIVHFANFFRWMESVEHEFFRSFGVRLHEEVEGVMHGYARVRADCEYKAPVRYGDVLHVHLAVDHKSTRSLGYRFVFSLEQAGKRRPVAIGGLRVVCVRRVGADGMGAADLPRPVADAVEVAPADLLHALGDAPA